MRPATHSPPRCRRPNDPSLAGNGRSPRVATIAATPSVAWTQRRSWRPRPVPLASADLRPGAPERGPHRPPRRAGRPRLGRRCCATVPPPGHRQCRRIQSSGPEFLPCIPVVSRYCHRLQRGYVKAGGQHQDAGTKMPCVQDGGSTLAGPACK